MDSDYIFYSPGKLQERKEPEGYHEEIVYHGSGSVIEKPEYGKGSRQNDYGRGFYCTESLELAKEWACAKNTDGYANKYELDLSGLKVLNLNAPEYSILNWLAVLAKNRTYWQRSSISEEAKRYLQQYFYIDTTKYDLILGYRADDSYFSFAQDFAANAISLEKLSEAMHLGRLGEQIVLISKRAFTSIRFLATEEVLSAEYFPKKSARDKEARFQYRRSKRTGADVNEIFMLDIMREGMKHGDSRLR